MLVRDTFECVLWKSEQAPKSKSDKPFRVWKRVREICGGKSDLNRSPRLKSVVKFADGLSQNQCDVGNETC